MPVYAAQAGKVVYAGAASGFGGPDPAGWLVIDHPAEHGAGTTAYGHIIREVGVGDWVEAGQRIARVNPSQATNGGVAPHLHFEVHPYTWLQGSQIDPIPWLGDAPSPGETVAVAPAAKEDAVRTIYGVDISNWQDGILASRIDSEGFRFCIIKATEGTWRDPILHSHLADVRKNSTMHVGAYVYVRAETSPQAHADTLHDHLGDTSVPIALDIENGSGADVGHFLAIRDAIEDRGYRVFLTYLPNWYWKQIGRPDLTGLPPLWTSWYPDMNADYASVIYQRSGDAGWEGYGGLSVSLWQFTSTAKVAGMQIDANAFRGTEADLAALFGADAPPLPATTTSEEGFLMALNDDEQRELLTLARSIDTQLQGPNQNALPEKDRNPKGGRGWRQLGSNATGQWLTLVDALAHFKQVLADLVVRVDKIEKGK